MFKRRIPLFWRFLIVLAVAVALWPIALRTASQAQAASLTGINVYVGYADNLRPSPNFPVPWVGDTATTCVNCSGLPYDSGAIRLDNITSSPITVNDVSVNVHGNIFDLWGSFVIPPLSTQILAQTGGASENFDTSDFPITACGVRADPTNQPPTIALTLAGGATATYTDSGHVLDTGGFDSVCLNGGNNNESEPWQTVGTSCATSPSLVLTPASQTHPVNGTADVQATFTECGTPLPNSKVNIAVVSGPNTGTSQILTTNSNGQADFIYSSSLVGTDTIVGTVTNVTGGSITSNSVTVTWACTITSGRGYAASVPGTFVADTGQLPPGGGNLKGFAGLVNLSGPGYTLQSPTVPGAAGYASTAGGIVGGRLTVNSSGTMLNFRLRLTGSGTPVTIAGDTVQSSANDSCGSYPGGGTLTTGLTVNGVPVPATLAPAPRIAGTDQWAMALRSAHLSISTSARGVVMMTIVGPLSSTPIVYSWGTIVLNEQIVTPLSITVNAVHIHTNTGQDFIFGSSHADLG